MQKIKNPWLHKAGYNCICCSPTNPIGLHLEFWEDGGDVLTHWTPTQDHQGWLDTLHGGVQSMLLDEVAGWVVTRKLQTTGVTSKMDVQYLKPVSIRDKGLTIRARVAKQMRNVAYIEGELYDGNGELCTKATLTYFCASKQKAQEVYGFQGCELEDDEQNYDSLLEELYETFKQKGYTAEDFYGGCSLCGDANEFALDIIDTVVQKAYPDITKEDQDRLTSKLYAKLHKMMSHYN